MRVWIYPEDTDPTVLQEPGRKGISVFGAISITDGRLVTRITEGYNAFTFVEFLSVIHKKFPDSLFVLDNALYHHAGIVTDYAFVSQIDILFMPPYSPELNPIERVWKFIRKQALTRGTLHFWMT
ncbi:MAG: transposase [Candidatus Thermoplasmatota archaeon]|nr:transposase [Candidatus Thermoplasmatota archaeon]